MADMLNVLCVDDDDDALFITGISLELDRGISTKASRGGNDALAVLKSLDETFDCILLDVKMPEMSGPELLAAIRALPLHRQTPIVFLTASVRGADVQSYAALGALGVIAKPFDPLELAVEVRRLLATA